MYVLVAEVCDGGFVFECIIIDLVYDLGGGVLEELVGFEAFHLCLFGSILEVLILCSEVGLECAPCLLVLCYTPPISAGRMWFSSLVHQFAFHVNLLFVMHC